MSRIAKRFADLKKEGRAAFVSFITAGDPDSEATLTILESLSGAGVDVIELGVPFSDPMADGPAIQASSLRALREGMTLQGVIDLVRRFRKKDKTTPLVLMGYYNPIHCYGTARFLKEAADAGVDGLITVDLPPEEDEVLRAPASSYGIDIIRLATPTTNDARLAAVLNGASGFIYYVSIAGVTGTKTFNLGDVEKAVARLKAASGLPVCVGFGISTPEQAAAVAGFADGVVVGSAIVNRIAAEAENGQSREKLVNSVRDFCVSLSKSVHAAKAGNVVS